MNYKLKAAAFALLFAFSAAAQENNLTTSPRLSHYIQGVTNPEDLVEIPGSDWVVVSSMAANQHSSGAIYGIDKKSERIVPLFTFDTVSPGNSHHLARFAPHGIYIRQINVNEYRLFVINHGSREAIEIFRVYFESGVPKLSWERNIDFPRNVWANGLVIDARGEIYATSMYDPTDQQFLEKFKDHTPTGQVWKWNEADGWRPSNHIKFSGANGIAISPTGDYIYVSEWARQRVYKISTTNQSDTASVPVNFLPDNIRWTPEGKLIIAGQHALPVELFSRNGAAKKVVYFSVIRIDPVSLKVQQVLYAGDKAFASATVAIELNNTYWVGCVNDNKIAVYNKE